MTFHVMWMWPWMSSRQNSLHAVWPEPELVEGGAPLARALCPLHVGGATGAV